MLVHDLLLGHPVVEILAPSAGGQLNIFCQGARYWQGAGSVAHIWRQYKHLLRNIRTIVTIKAFHTSHLDSPLYILFYFVP